MLGRPLNTERRRHLPSSKILVDSYSQGYESPVFEIQDVPLFLQLFGANSSNVARVYTVLNGIEQPFIVDESIVALNSVNPTYTLRLSGRYKIKLEGDIGPFVTATKQLVGLDRNREVSQPSGVQANLPNLFLDGQTLSPVIEVQQDPWLFTVYGLVGIDEVLVYSVYGQGATYAQTQLTSNGQPVKLTTANTSIVINKSGRYRFELIGSPIGVKLVGNPTLVDTTIASGESGGGVTYVGLSVPVGFTVSGSPVTSAGQIDIDFDAGYTAYTTIEQTKLATIQTGAEVNVNADWNAASGDAQILNKPVLGTMAAENAADYTPTSGFGSAAFQPSSAFATAAQGALANTALQPGDNVSELLNDAAYVDASGASAAAPVQSVNGETGAVSLDATDVGADASGTAASTMAAHLAASDPHPQYLTGAEGDASFVHKTGAETITGEKTFETEGLEQLILVGYSDFTAPLQIRLSKARGTKASPSAVLANDVLFSAQGRGYGSTGFGGNRGDLQIFAAENFTDTAQGTSFRIRTGNIGSAAGVVTRLTASQFEVSPGVDNFQSSGDASHRWSVVYAATGSINTSDAREKTAVTPLTENELACASALAKEIGWFKWLDAIEKKGEEGARKHVGMTVQRVIEVMQAHGMDPFEWGFVCYDQWPETIEPAEYEDVIDENGAPTGERILIREAVIHPAGDMYSLRDGELLKFIARGQEQRLAAIEAHLGL